MRSTPESIGLPLRWCSRIEEFDETGCWLWVGAHTKAGYGVTYYQGRQMNAHRAVYEFLHGALVSKQHVDHLCRVPPCVNPDHMEPVTCAENIRRGDAPAVTRQRHASVTTCPRGHEYTEGNTGFSTLRNYSVRYCRECKRIKSAERRASR